MTRLTLVLLTLPLLSLPSLPAYAYEPWPTTKFKVFSGNPFIGSNVVDEEIGFDWAEFEDLFGPGPEAIEEIERALSEAAVWYKNNGFPPPLLEPLIDTEEGRAYQVFVCNEEWDQWITDTASNILVNTTGLKLQWGQCVSDSSGSYMSLCKNNPEERTKFMVINSERSLDDDGNLTAGAYQTFAHELMHAIMGNTPLGQSCANWWITEGIPDAISFDIAEKLWQDRYFADNSDQNLIKQYGFRPYSVYLPENRKLAGAPGTTIKFDFKYTASSFWRYLADSHTKGWGVLVTSKTGGAPGLLDRAIPSDTSSGGSADWQLEAAWLNKGLEDKFSRNLAMVYGSFVNNYAFRFPPMKNYRGRPVEEVLPKWVKNVFGDCAIADLSSARFQTITLSVRKLAAGCIWVESIGVPGLVHVSFQTHHEDISLFEDITIGMAGTMLLSTAVPIAPSPFAPSLYLGSWRDFPQDGSKRTLYIVSNIAKDPELSKERHLVFDVSRPEYAGPGMDTVPLPSRLASRPQPPGFDKHAVSMARQKRATSKMVEEQMNLDKKSLNPNVSSSTNVIRRPNVPECFEPFKYDACGPHFQISLGLVPGTFIAPGQTNAQGGMAAQVFGGLQAMSATSLNLQNEVKELSAIMDSIDGSSVSIAMPLIDYGYSGTISNAAINVDMSGGNTLRAFGPPDETGRGPLRGRVTIEEYNPFIIRGSFSAPLAEFVEGGVYTSRQTISGSFTSVAPWQNDERVQFILDSNEEMADDIASSLGVPADMIYSMKQDGSMPGSSSTGSGTSSGGTVGTVKCTCECKMKPFADELCELLCEEEFAACESP